MSCALLIICAAGISLALLIIRTADMFCALLIICAAGISRALLIVHIPRRVLCFRFSLRPAGSGRIRHCDFFPAQDHRLPPEAKPQASLHDHISRIELLFPDSLMQRAVIRRAGVCDDGFYTVFCQILRHDLRQVKQALSDRHLLLPGERFKAVHGKIVQLHQLHADPLDE